MVSLWLANLFKAVVQHHIYSTTKVCTVYFINNLLNDKSWKRVKTCTYHSVQKKKTLKKIIWQKFWWMHTFIVYKLWCYKKISRPEKSSNDTRRKIRYFSGVFDITNQLLTRHSPFTSLVDEWTAKSSPFSVQSRLSECSQILSYKLQC